MLVMGLSLPPSIGSEGGITSVSWTVVHGEMKASLDSDEQIKTELV